MDLQFQQFIVTQIIFNKSIQKKDEEDKVQAGSLTFQSSPFEVETEGSLKMKFITEMISKMEAGETHKASYQTKIRIHLSEKRQIDILDFNVKVRV